MLKEPLFRLGLVLTLASVMIAMMPFYDRNSAFAFMNLVFCGISFLTMLAGVVKATGGLYNTEERD